VTAPNASSDGTKTPTSCRTNPRTSAGTRLWAARRVVITVQIGRCFARFTNPAPAVEFFGKRDPGRLNDRGSGRLEEIGSGIENSTLRKGIGSIKLRPTFPHVLPPEVKVELNVKPCHGFLRRSAICLHEGHLFAALRTLGRDGARTRAINDRQFRVLGHTESLLCSVAARGRAPKAASE
jgi:hypothetical protein